MFIPYMTQLELWQLNAAIALEDAMRGMDVSEGDLIEIQVPAIQQEDCG